MPWPMMHFSIAVELYHSRPHPCFLLGSIAPDTVLIKDNSRQEYEKVHLFKNSSTMAEIQEIKDFYFFYKKQHPGEEYKLFLLGYIGHIISDIRWVEYKRKATVGLENNTKEILLAEENQNDFIIYNNVWWRKQIVNDLFCSPLIEIEDYFTREELGRWRRKLVNWLENQTNEPKITLRYLHEAIVHEYIGSISTELRELFKELDVKRF